MTDSEHEYLQDGEALRAEVAFLRDIAVRALHSAIEAQDDASGQHDDWLDEALRLVREEQPARQVPRSPEPA